MFFILGHFRYYSTTIRTESLSTSVAGQQKIAKHLDIHPILGQPTPWTHPHLLQPTEIGIGVNRHELQSRKDNVMRRIQSYARNLKKDSLNHVVNFCLFRLTSVNC